MKKLMSLLVSTMLCTTGFTALADAATTTELPLTEEPVTFTICIGRQTLDLSDNYNEKIAAQQSEADTNVHIDWVELTDSTERANLMLASGDMTDAFISILTEAQLLKNTSQFVVLNDLIPDNAPNVKAQYDSIDGMWDKVTMTDGNIYTLANGNYTNKSNWAGGIPVCNTAWMEKLNLEMPTTMDEFYNVLVAIRDGDPNGNGLQDEIPLEFCQNDWCTHILEYAGSWGFTDYYKVEDGKFIATPTLPEFREFLEFYHKLAAEGLLDVEGFSQTMQQWVTKAKEDKCFMFYTWTADGLFDAAKAAEFEVIKPVAAEGCTPVVSGQMESFQGNRFGFAISKTCSDPALMLRWFDYQNRSTESKLTWQLGEEGKLWEIEDGTSYLIYPEATSDMSVENMKYTYGNVAYIPCLLSTEEVAIANPVKSPTSAVRDLMVDQITDCIRTEALPVRSAPADKVNERALIYNDLKAYLDGFVATSIMEGVTDDSWNAHIANCEAYGLNEWAQWYQDFIDQKF